MRTRTGSRAERNPFRRLRGGFNTLSFTFYAGHEILVRFAPTFERSLAI